MKDRNNASRQTVRYICGRCWVWGPSSTARGIYQWDNQTYISGTQIWILIGRKSNLEIKICKSLHAVTQHVKIWEVMRTFMQNNSEDWRITKDIIWEKKRLRLELPKHSIRNCFIFCCSVQNETSSLFHQLVVIIALSTYTHMHTHTEFDVLIHWGAYSDTGLPWWLRW